MSNLIERLRNADLQNAPSRCMEAAREIERLREALKRIAEYDHRFPESAADVARRALSQTQGERTP